MTLQQLKYVIEVSRCGSINEAAKKLYVSQPSISSAIKELEDEMHLKIFDRTNKGISVSKSGAEFLGYAKQIMEQANLLENRYLENKPQKQLFAVSAQHYAFVVNAFVNLVKAYNYEEYEFAISETTTYKIIEDVHNLRSEIGVLYLNEFNEKVINRLLKENGLEFHKLFDAKAHIFVSKTNPLARKNMVTLADLEDYPCLSFEQGEYNSFHFSEEILSTLIHKKDIKVSDRATLFNLLIGLNGYTISTGVLSKDLNGNDIIPIPLECKEDIKVGWIAHKKITLSAFAEAFVEELKKVNQENI